MKFKTIEEIEAYLKSHVAVINRMLKQHPESVGALVWISMKEYIEKELLGESIEYCE